MEGGEKIRRDQKRGGANRTEKKRWQTTPERRRGNEKEGQSREDKEGQVER